MNYSALTQQPSKAHIAQFERAYPASRMNLRFKKIALGILIVFGGLFLIGGTQSLTLSHSTGDNIGGSVFTLVLAAVMGIGIVFLFLAARKQRIESAKIALFAQQNGFRYTRMIDGPTYTGMYFGIGYRRALSNIITSQRSTPKFEIGNLNYTIRTGKSESTYRKGYIRIELERNLPQIVLDASSNNLKMFGKNITNLPEDFDTSQRMNLEGDFNKYFTLYAPKEYERDALYIFTPDLMALMIDNVSAFDAEIIDNQLFIYKSQAPFVLTDGALLDRLFKIIEVVGNKAHTQTNFYADEKVGDRSLNEVATGGKRLRKRISVVTVIIIVIIFAAIVGPLVFGQLGVLNEVYGS